MDLRRLRYFVVLAETLHFSRAAARLNIAQPPLSHQIKVLEEELDAKLFERSNRRVELTPAGKALLPEALALLAQADRASGIAASVQRGELGELRVGFTSGAALTDVIPRLILAFRQRRPGVRVRIEEMTTQAQLVAMLERRIDIAFIRSAQAPDLPPTLGAMRLFEDALVVALPPKHPLSAGSGPLSVSALANEEFVIFPPESGTGVFEQIVWLCRLSGFAPRVVQEALTAVTIVGLVAAGLGIALVPASFRRVAVTGVSYRRLRNKEAKSAMWMVFRTGTVSEQERAFRELAGA
ncbi:LysR family transcriptional regulator [Cupriavidus pauculus]|uniref:LysR family transcriptional regulator n=1 Tax=Cupriavidus pauculus TaxID=82633 RepID=A0A5P2H1U6_9BURK|nr:LysR family transcriptional regulator [Cupriavidus pauculus]QET01788.1 LysR family transcriptional regulator [Cupriavidus pauculus]